MGWMVNATPRLLYPHPSTRERDAVSLQRKLVVAAGQVWAGVGNLAPLPQPGFDPRSVQTVENSYND
jgi:hypothetical protein